MDGGVLYGSRKALGTHQLSRVRQGLYLRVSSAVGDVQGAARTLWRGLGL